VQDFRQLQVWQKALDQLIEIKRMLSGLIAKLKADG
jgi:hypothetical protein